MRDPRHDILFEPLQVGSKVFRNRFYSTPHASFVAGRRMSDIAFRRMKAAGGFAAVCGGVISLRSDAWGGLVARIWDEDDRVMLGRVATEIRSQGALAGIEFGHGGAHGIGSKFSPALAASQIPDPGSGHLVPKAMDLDDIEEIQRSWIAAAGVAADLGYDIIYSYGSHGTLPAQFLSPFYNRRTDRYGGSIENRARFWLELTQGIRSEVGDRCLVAARIASEPFSPEGVPFEDSLAFVEMADELVDLWDVNVGFGWEPDSSPSRLTEEGYQVEFSGRMRTVTDKPIIGVSRLTNPDLMADILRSGVWDMIGSARPGIADPFLPRKIEEGRYDDIRECTGTNFCIAVETTGIGLGCVQNATVGEEYRRRWHPEKFTSTAAGDRAVLIVGAGPAGLECARVLGERGFENVHLVEARDDVGGHLAWLRRLPGLGDWGRVIDYRKTQIGKLPNVQVIPRSHVDADDVLDYGASIVIIATGSKWMDAEDLWRGHSPSEGKGSGLTVLTPEDVMVDEAEAVGDVVVWDGDGGAVGVGLAERLAAAGHHVTIATPHRAVAPLLDQTFEGAGTRARLKELGIACRTALRLVQGGPRGVRLLDSTDESELPLQVDTLVLVTQRFSNDGLFRTLRGQADRIEQAGIDDLLRIGDCVAPRHFGLAVADGHRMARELDSGRPGRPLEPIVERDHHGAVAEFGWAAEVEVPIVDA